MNAVRICWRCGVLKPCDRRIEGHRACRACAWDYRFPKTATCPQCGRTARTARRVDGRHVCDSCAYKRLLEQKRACTTCGKMARLYAGLCGTHYLDAHWERFPVRCCRGCRREWPCNTHGLCRACDCKAQHERSVKEKLCALFTDEGLRQPVLRALYTHLTCDRKPAKILVWLRTLDPKIREYLADVAAGAPLERAALEELAPFAGGAMLLSSCERAELLAPRAPRYERIEATLNRRCKSAPRWIRVLLSEFWRFCLRPAVELRRYHKRPIDVSLHNEWTYLQTAFDFLVTLEAQNVTLDRLSQADVDRWLARRPRWKGEYLRRFLSWLHDAHRLTYFLTIPPNAVRLAIGCSEVEFLTVLDRARRDACLPLAVRVALLLVARCGKSVGEVVQIRIADISTSPRSVVVRFPKGCPQVLFGVEAKLIASLCSQSRRWLFETAWSEQLRAHGLVRRIRKAGVPIDLRLLTNGARRQMLELLEPGELVQILGHGPAQADEWRKRLA